MIKYTLKLIFPKKPKKNVVSNADYQVTSEPPTLPQLNLPLNTMPEIFYPGDTLKITYDRKTKRGRSRKINSCIHTLYPLRDTIDQRQYTRDGNELITDFLPLFGEEIEITPAFKGTWIFHLLGMYTQHVKTKKGKVVPKKFCFYLDPEASCG